MNIKRRIVVALMAVAMLVALLPCIFASAADGAVTAKGYMVGNSLTMSMSPRRLAALLKTQGYNVTLGGQLNGDTSLPEQIGMLPADSTDEYGFISWMKHKDNTDEVRENGQSLPGAKSDSTHGLDASLSGRYFEAMRQEHYDFVSLQSYGAFVNTPEKWEDFAYDHTVTVKGKEYYEYQYLGDRQAIGLMVDYAVQQKRENNKGADVFLVYETWTYMHYMGGKNFSDFYEAPYSVKADVSTAGNAAKYVTPKRAATEELMSGLREDFAYLGDAIRLVPVAEIFAKLDTMIREESLPGFAEYMERNKEYYMYARKTAPSGVPDAFKGTQQGGVYTYDNVYVPEQGVFNLFVDSVHMASFKINYPDGTYNGYHSGERDGTLASYITACAMYSVLTGYSPVGLPVDMNTTDRKAQYAAADKGHDARLDPELDAELINAVQQVVFEVLAGNEYTGVTSDAPRRTAATTGHINGNGQFTRTAAEILAEAPARIATGIAVAVAENPVWTPSNAPVAAPVTPMAEEKRTKEV